MAPVFVLQQIPPDIRPNVDEIACHEDHHIVLIAVLHPSDSQARNHSSQRHEVDHSVPHHRLIASESTLYEDADIPHLPRNLMRDDGYHHRHVDSRVSSPESDPYREAIEEVVNEGGEQVQVTRSLLPPQRLKAPLLGDLVVVGVFRGLLSLALLLILLLLILLQAVRRLVLVAVVIVLILSPMVMRHPQHLKQSFQDQEEDDCADKNKRHDLAVGLRVFEGIGEDMNDCIADDGSAAERVEHVDQRHEELGSDEGLDADEEDGSDKADSRDADTHQDAVNPRLLLSDALPAVGSTQQEEKGQPASKRISH